MNEAACGGLPFPSGTPSPYALRHGNIVDYVC